MPLHTELRAAVRMDHLAGGPGAWTVRNYRVTATDGSDSALDFAQAFNAMFDVAGRRLLPTTVTVTEVITGLSITPTVAAATLPVGLPGYSGIAKFFPVQLTALIRLTWSGMSSRHPGRVFHPYVPMWPTSTSCTAWQNNLDGYRLFLTQDIFGVASPDVTYSPVIWHRASGTSSLVDGSLNPDGKFYTQRRRAKSLLERTSFLACAGPL